MGPEWFPGRKGRGQSGARLGCRAPTDIPHFPGTWAAETVTNLGGAFLGFLGSGVAREDTRPYVGFWHKGC